VESPRSVLGFLSRPVKRVGRYEYCIRCNSKRVSSAELIERACSGPSEQSRALRNRRGVVVEETRMPSRPDPRGLKRNESPYDVPSGVEEQLPPVCSPPFRRAPTFSSSLLALGPLMRVARRLDSLPFSSESPFVTRSITSAILLGYSMEVKGGQSSFLRNWDLPIRANNDRAVIRHMSEARL